MLGDLIIPVDSLSISLGMELSITLKAWYCSHLIKSWSKCPDVFSWISSMSETDAVNVVSVNGIYWILSPKWVSSSILIGDDFPTHLPIISRSIQYKWCFWVIYIYVYCFTLSVTYLVFSLVNCKCDTTIQLKLGDNDLTSNVFLFFVAFFFF